MISMLAIPVHAWSYGNPATPDDGIFEKYGPHANKLLIKLYTTETSEWEAGLEGHQIDVTDWPLDETHYNRYVNPPWDAEVKVMGYGPEFGLYEFDLNNNNNLYLGNPPNPAYPNPVYPNPMSELSLRKAVAYLSNKQKIVQYNGPLVTIALYTPVGPSAGKFSHPDIKPGGAREDLCYLYSTAAAAATLDAGKFPVGPDGWRYWDKDNDHVKDAGEDFSLKIVARVDSPTRDFAGSDLYIELTNIKIHCTIQHMPSGAARLQVMSAKNFHIYTGGWSLTVDPDFLILWNWDFYWHPGNPSNYDGCNIPAYNDASYGVMYANNQVEALDNALLCQLIFAENVLMVPLYTSQGQKVAARAYTGTPGVPDAEDVYEGKYWEGYVNIPGYGTDNGYTFLNLRPEGGPCANGDMTIRYGFKTQEVKTFNPVYAEWLWDNTVIDLVGYDSLIGRNPYNLGEFQPWLALTYSVGTYTHPVYGTCSKVVFTLRPGIQWSDGTPITIADIYFTFVEIDGILEGRGLPPPWWISNVMNILSFSILDAENFEVLLDVKTVFAVGWIGGNRILPKHIWKPIVTIGDPTATVPDKNMINSGAWRIKEYVENSHVLLVANAPHTTVTNNFAGSTPVTSDLGFFRYYKVIAEVRTPGDKFKMKLTDAPTINFTFVNLTHEPANISYVISGEDAAGVPMTNLTGNFAIIPGFDKIGVPYLPPWTWGHWHFHILILLWCSCGHGGCLRAVWYWCMDIYWITIKEDIAGSTWYNDVGLSAYPYKSELPTPDIKVDIQDVARASAAFGSYPGSNKWNTVADQNSDYKIDIQDLARISAKFGWHG
jgi:ABC-type transport system substrate-binding protein